DKVVDVRGEVRQGKNLADLLLEAAASARSMEDILRELDIQVDETYIARVRENLGESLATHFIDYTRIREMADQAREHRLIPEYTEAFFKRAMDEIGGKWHVRQDRKSISGQRFLNVENIPFGVRQIAEADTFKNSLRQMMLSL